MDAIYDQEMSWTYYKEKFVEFIGSGIYILVYTIILFSGSEGNFYLAVLINDDIELVAYASWSNTLMITYLIAVGVAAVARLNVGLLIGSNNIEDAKLLAQFNHVIIIIIGIIQGLLLFFLRTYISHVYSHIDVVTSKIED